ncbi:helix-turn-helix protein [Streptomyces sp. Amel2xB2]|nr:helix-turn-helix protein [Streptomyces sp. Amel2xB2]
MGGVLRGERRAQQRTLKDVADAARISMPYLSEVERGRKEASSEVLAAAAEALGLGLTDVLALVQGELARVRRARAGAGAGVRAGVRGVRERGASPVPAAPAAADEAAAEAPAETEAASEAVSEAPAESPASTAPASPTASATPTASGTPTASVSALSTRRAAKRPAPPRPGDVRLAA